MQGTLAPELESPPDLAAPDAGAGARLYVYVSPQNNTAKVVHSWSVTFTHEGSNWTGTITSREPRQQLQTPKLSGRFKIKAVAEVGPKPLQQPLKPRSPSTDVIGCNQNCTSFVGIVADPGGTTATYWTTWDAVCAPGG